MDYTYNVLYEKWIPVIKMDSGEVVDVSLEDAILGAHNYRAVAEDDKFPIFKFVIMRFLGLFALDAYGGSKDDLRRILEDGCFNKETFARYIKKMDEEGVSFNLLDQEKPFMQTDKATFEKIRKKGTKPSSVDVINPFLGGKVFFNHVNYEEYAKAAGVDPEDTFFYSSIYNKKVAPNTTYDLSFKEYLKLLLYSHCLSGSGGSGYRPGLMVGSGIPPIVYLAEPTGKYESLFYAIIFNTYYKDFSFGDADVPMWRWKSYDIGIEAMKKGEDPCTSLKSGLFFPVFFIYPDFESIDYEHKTISRVYKVGITITPKSASDCFNDFFKAVKAKWILDEEPSVALKNIPAENAKIEDTCKSAVIFTENNRTWMDIRSYANMFDRKAPKILSELESYSRRGPFKNIFREAELSSPNGLPFELTSYYVTMDKAKYLLQGRYSCEIKRYMLENEEKMECIKEFVDYAEGKGAVLLRCVNTLKKKLKMRVESKSIDRGISNQYLRYCEGLFKNHFILDLEKAEEEQLTDLCNEYMKKIYICFIQLLKQFPVPYGKAIKAEIELNELLKEEEYEEEAI